ncbi:MAG TPA: hypothetical protein DDW30_09470 [Clostridiales bacterium]|nr:hypothetical protein [Clostridiales bacterium]
MTEAIEKLKNSLTYQMSLGGRELFHSNVWCWLMKQDSAFIRVFFPSFDPEKDKVESIQREWLNMDLVIKLANQKIYIIENKLKSLPYPEQLQKYTENVEAKGHRILGKVYTGVCDTLTKEERKGWDFISYSDIAEGIEKQLEYSPLSNEQKAQIREYCSNIHCMIAIVNHELKSSENRLINSSGKELNDVSVRLQDLCIKLKGADFVDHLRKAFVHESSLKITLGFNRKKSTIDIYYENESEKDPSPILGIQIEGTQYRRFALQKSGDANADSLFVKYAEKGLFDSNYNKAQSSVFGHPTTMKPRDHKKYDSYKKDGESCFVYQYYDITNETNSYTDLAKQIRDDLARIRRIREAAQ